MSLLREIQNDLAGPSQDIATVLRKCKILAARLGSEDLSHWVDWELDGYPESVPTPAYRRLGANCYASFMNIAWKIERQPVLWELLPERARELFRNFEFRGGVAKVEGLVANGCRIDRPDFALMLQGKMYPDMGCFAAWMAIPGSEFGQLVSAIKNRILDFVLRIEGENPAAGEAAINSNPVQLQKLQPLVNNFFGAVGNVAQNSQHFGQTAESAVQPGELARLIEEVTVHFDELGLNARQRERALAQISALRAELGDEGDGAAITQAGRTLRSIVEGAVASLLATAAQPAVWQWVHYTLSRF
jgi:hypothetical protein